MTALDYLLFGATFAGICYGFWLTRDDGKQS